MVQVDTFGTGKVCADDCLEMAIPLVFGLTPKQIVDTLRLTHPIFRQTAAFGPVSYTHLDVYKRQPCGRGWF